jgi:hypothetical protein
MGQVMGLTIIELSEGQYKAVPQSYQAFKKKYFTKFSAGLIEGSGSGNDALLCAISVPIGKECYITSIMGCKDAQDFVLRLSALVIAPPTTLDLFRVPILNQGNQNYNSNGISPLAYIDNRLGANPIVVSLSVMYLFKGADINVAGKYFAGAMYGFME